MSSKELWQHRGPLSHHTHAASDRRREPWLQEPATLDQVGGRSTFGDPTHGYPCSQLSSACPPSVDPRDSNISTWPLSALLRVDVQHCRAYRVHVLAHHPRRERLPSASAAALSPAWPPLPFCLPRPSLDLRICQTRQSSWSRPWSMSRSPQHLRAIRG